MSFVQELVDGMVAVLKERLPPKFRVSECPDKIRDYDLGTYDGAAIVHYRGSKYASRADAPNGYQMRSFDVDVHLLTRGLSGAAGANALVEEVRLALQGQQFAGAMPLVITEDGLAEENGSIWTYTISFRGGITTVARRAAPAPFITSIDLQPAAGG